MERKRILQIMPAEGWRAWYKDESGTERYQDPLVCWALVEPLPKDLEGLTDQDPALWRYVVGIVVDADGESEVASEIANFSRYEKGEESGRKEGIQAVVDYLKEEIATQETRTAGSPKLKAHLNAVERCILQTLINTLEEWLTANVAS